MGIINFDKLRSGRHEYLCYHGEQKGNVNSVDADRSSYAYSQSRRVLPLIFKRLLEQTL